MHIQGFTIGKSIYYYADLRCSSSSFYVEMCEVRDNKRNGRTRRCYSLLRSSRDAVLVLMGLARGAAAAHGCCSCCWCSGCALLELGGPRRSLRCRARAGQQRGETGQGQSRRPLPPSVVAGPAHLPSCHLLHPSSFLPSPLLHYHSLMARIQSSICTC